MKVFDEAVCVICLEVKPNLINHPCNHACLCGCCFSKLKAAPDCPICRQQIDHTTRLGKGEAKKRLVRQFYQLLESIFLAAEFADEAQSKKVAAHAFKILSGEIEDFREALYQSCETWRMQWIYFAIPIRIARFAFQDRDPKDVQKLLVKFGSFFQQEVVLIDLESLKAEIQHWRHSHVTFLAQTKALAMMGSEADAISSSCKLRQKSILSWKLIQVQREQIKFAEDLMYEGSCEESRKEQIELGAEEDFQLERIF